jgi:cyclophilin family peptidyl-prolyl cis-trans isomerase
MPFVHDNHSTSQRSRDYLARRNKRKRFVRGNFFRRMQFEHLESRQMLSISPTFSSLGTTFYNDQQDLYVPLTSGDTGNSVTYSVTSNSNASFTAQVLTGNPTIDINMSGNGFTNQDITFQLFANLAPNTVTAIENLIQNNAYSTASFYRVLAALSGDGDFMLAQGGVGGAGTGTAIDDEFNPAVTFNSPGIIGLARGSNNDTGNSEFFVTDPTASYGVSQDTTLEQSLNFKYAAFGQLTSGFAAFQQMMTTPVTTSSSGEDSQPVTPITINSIKIVTDTQNAVLHIQNLNKIAGSDNVTIVASDGISASKTETLTVKQQSSSVVDPPFLASIPVSNPTAEGTATRIVLSAYDPSNLSLTYIVTDPNNFGLPTANVTVALNQVTGVVTLTPASGFSGNINLLAGVSGTTSPTHRTQYDTQAFALDVYVNAGTLSPSTLPADTVNVAYNQTITATDAAGNTTLTLSNVQNAITGLVLTPGPAGSNSLAISGTPTVSGVATFTVTATDGNNGTTIGYYSITVNPAVILIPATLSTATQGVAYNQTINGAYGTGVVSFAVSKLQNAIPGLVVPASGSSINITGTPTASGTETFTVTATDSAGGVTSMNYQLVVGPPVDPNSPSLGTYFLVEPAKSGSDTDLLSFNGSLQLSWTALSNNSWLHLTGSSAAGSGSGTILFTFDANPFQTARTGTITIAGNTLTVTQAGTSYVSITYPTVLASMVSRPPESVAVDGSGNVYMVESINGTVMEWLKSSNTVITLVSSGLNFPEGVAVDASGNIYIADFNNNAIKEWVRATNNVITLVSTGLADPFGVAVDGSGNVYIADTANRAIKEWVAATKTVTTLVSSGLGHAEGVTVDVSGNLYIADSDDNAIEEWVRATKQLTALVSTGVSYPIGVAVDGSGNVYFADVNNKAIKEWVRATNSVTALLATGLPNPWGVAVDGSGNVYVVDANNGLLEELPRAYIGPAFRLEPLAAGSDALLSILPASASLSGPFLPTSDQAWLTIGAIGGGVVNYSFTATATSRSANITILRQTILVTQLSLFQQTVKTLTVLSDPNNDNLQVTFTSPTNFTVDLDGTSNNYTTAGVNKVIFAGADASATAIVNDDFNTLTSAVLTPTTMTVKAAAYEVDVTSTPTNTVSGLAADTATLSGMSGTNQFYGKPAISELLNTDAGTAYTETVDSFGTVSATSSSKSDVAYLYDNTGTNTYTGSPTTAKLVTTGYTYNATTFPVVYAIGSAVNNDTAYLSDAAGGIFNGFPTSAVSYGTGYYNYARNFKVVYDTMASANNQAFLYDTSGANAFQYHAASGGNPAYSVFYDPAGGFYNLVTNSLQVTATAAAGTTDQAYLVDNTNNSQLYGKPTSTLLSTSGTTNFLANNFGNVQTTETGTASSESAYMYDSTGADRFYGTPPGFGGSAVPVSVVAGTGYSSVAISFGQSYGISAGGGKDYAYLYDAAGNGTFYGATAQDTMQGTGYYYTAVGFRYVFGLGAGGGDTAYFTDTVGGNFFEGHQPYSVLYNQTNLYVDASGFTSVSATGNGNKKNDTAFLLDAPTNDYILALNDSAQLGYNVSGITPTTVVNVAAFANVQATSSAGGTDKKFLSAVDYNLQVTGNWQ